MPTIHRRRINAQIHEAVSASRSAPAHYRHSPAWHPIGVQQSLWDNQTLQRMLRTGAIQAKLDVTSPDDKYEREVERVAEKIMCRPQLPISRNIAMLGRIKFSPRLQARPTE